jgi:diacylglycerol kinase (ATP)
MTPIALLHPSLSDNVINPFRHICSDLSIQNQITEHTSAALIFGGDGTIHRHLPELSRRKIPTLVVPKGSGNDFAKTLGIKNEQTALAAWETFCERGNNVRAIDLGAVRSEESGQETLFCCVAGCGLDAAANARANRMPGWLRSHGGYLLALSHSVAIAKAVKMKLTAADRKISNEAFLIAIGNAHRYGSGAKITPKAQLDDGLLDACFVGSMSKFKLLLCLPTVFLGRHLGIKQVDYLQAPVLRLATEHPVAIYADGEPAGRTPARLSIVPRALRVIVPAQP